MPSYTIYYADSYPDQPGTGGMDNNEYFEVDFEGTREEAALVAERLRHERFGGDLVWWISANVSAAPQSALSLNQMELSQHEN